MLNTPDDKLQALYASINAAEMGLTKIVHCPYCGVDNNFSPQPEEDYEGPPLCCLTFFLASEAIMERKTQNNMKDLASRVRDTFGGVKVFT